MQSFLFKSAWRYQKTATLDDAKVGNRKVGMLGYDNWGLINVILLILLACAGFITIQVLIMTLLPKQFKDAGASNTVIAFFITTMPYAVTMVVNPVVSFWSDRTRTKRGRRIPYLLYTTPVIALFCLLIGWSGKFGPCFDSLASACGVNGTLASLAVLTVAYNIFFMIPGAVFWYLFPDVIPDHFIGRFMSYYQLVTSLAALILNRYFLKFADTHIEYLYSAVAVFFLITMLIMIICVKEGGYPPVESPDKKLNLLDFVKTYCRECYSVGFYYSFFITMALSEVSMICRNMYNLIYAQDVLHVSTENFGIIMGYYGVVGVALSLPLGYLCDKLNPLKIFAAGLFLVVVVNLWSFFYVKDYNTFFITSMLLSVVYTIQMVSTIPVFVAILPKELYGQFCSANALFRAVFMAVGGLGCGLMLDWIKNYQYIYFWDFVFTLGALISFIKLYIDWQKRGGQNGYIPPLKP